MARKPEGSKSAHAWAASLLTLIVLTGLTVLATRHAADAPRYRVATANIAVASMPAWLPGGAKEAGLDRALLAGECSVFDPNLPALAAKAATNKPWVREVRRVERVFPDKLELEVELRTPVAMLVHGNERIAVDAEGFVLERNSQIKQDTLALIAASGGTPPAAGAQLQRPKHDSWMDAVALVAALRAAGDHPALETLRVKEVRVETVAGASDAARRSLVIVSDKPARIRWGAAPLGAAAPEETRHKLDALRLALVRNEGLVGLEEVDLTFPGGCDVRERKAH